MIMNSKSDLFYNFYIQLISPHQQGKWLSFHSIIGVSYEV